MTCITYSIGENVYSILGSGELTHQINVKEPGFEGGQCKGVDYNFVVRYRLSEDREYNEAVIGTGSFTPGEISDLKLIINTGITGLIEGFPYVEGVARSGYFLLSASANGVPFSFSFGHTGIYEVTRCEFIGVQRADGQPDICGNAPTKYNLVVTDENGTEVFNQTFEEEPTILPCPTCVEYFVDGDWQEFKDPQGLSIDIRAIKPNFSGGQCEGESYLLNWSPWQPWGQYGGEFNNLITGKLLGIKPFRIAGGSGQRIEWRVLTSSGVAFTTLGDSYPTIPPDGKVNSLVRTDGLLDNCGNPPTTYNLTIKNSTGTTLLSLTGLEELPPNRPCTLVNLPRFEWGVDLSQISTYSYKTNVIKVGAYDEQRLSLWRTPLGSWQLGDRLLSTAQEHMELQYLRDFFISQNGSEKAFRYKDWADFSAVNEPVISLGNNNYQLMKLYGDQLISQKYIVPGTLTLYFGYNIIPASQYYCDFNTGIVTLYNGLLSYATFEFDKLVRFSTDNFSVRREGIDLDRDIELLRLESLTLSEVREQKLVEDYQPRCVIEEGLQGTGSA